MAQDSRSYRNLKGTFTSGLVFLAGRHTTTTSGTLSTTATAFSQPVDCGYTLTKTATETGRYTVQLVAENGSTAVTYAELLGVTATLTGADDTAYTVDKGLIAVVRDNDVASDGTFEIQFVNGDANADAEVEDGAVILINIVVRNTLV